jgi:RNA polymerase-binding protein DksA
VDTSAARSRLEKSLAQLPSNDRALLEERAPSDLHLAHLSQHPADYGTDLSDAEREDAVRGAVEREISQIKQALQRIDDGTYGTCTACGKPIGIERLEAYPWASLCIDDARKAER